MTVHTCPTYATSQEKRHMLTPSLKILATWDAMSSLTWEESVYYRYK